jgi:hypothetical protein
MALVDLEQIALGPGLRTESSNAFARLLGCF